MHGVDTFECSIGSFSHWLGFLVILKPFEESKVIPGPHGQVKGCVEPVYTVRQGPGCFPFSLRSFLCSARHAVT